MNCWTRKSSRFRHVRRTQDGYVLVTTLAVMLLSVVVVISLLAVTASTISIEETGRDRERQVRAAESAAELAVNAIRNSPTAASAGPPNLKQGPREVGGVPIAADKDWIPGKPDSEQAPKEPGDVGYDPLRDPTINRGAANSYCDPVDELVEVDGYPVRIYCYNDGLWKYDENGNVVPGIPQDDGGTAVRLVGGNYVGDLTTESAGFTDVARDWKSTFPFSSAIGSGYNSTLVNATAAQLLYRGATPLRIVGGVEVRNQIAAVHQTSGAAGPAIEAEGVVRQGGKGVLSAGTGPTDCGIARTDDPNNSPRADVVTASLFVAPGEALLCNQADVQSMSAGGLIAPDGDWNNAQVLASRYHDWDGNGSRFDVDGRYDTMPTDCGPLGNQITLPAGSYDRHATKILNDWFRDGSCDDRTYIFEEGNYYFDVYDPTVPDGDPRMHSLVFGNRSSNWVFGKPTWSGSRPLVSQFPEVCDRGEPSPPNTSSGVSITLSSRTGLHHTGGRVAICGPIVKDGTQTTAIYQRPATSLGARLVPTGVSKGTFGGPDNALQATDSSVLRQSLLIHPKCWDGGACTAGAEFTATGFTDGAAGATDDTTPIGSLWVDVVGNGSNLVANSSEDSASTRFDLTLSGMSTPICWMRFGPEKAYSPRVPDNSAFVSYDLKSDPAAGTSDGVDGTCDTALGTATRASLKGASVKVSFELNPPKLRNSKFDWLRSLPWPLSELATLAEAICGPAVNFINGIIDGLPDWVNAVIEWLTGNPAGHANYYKYCDDRPPSIDYTVNSIALRIGWSPQFSTPVDATNAVDNRIPVTNALNGTMANPAFATVSMPSNWNPAQANSYSNLRYELRDPTLLDGFLPLDDVNFGWKITHSRSSGAPHANDEVQFTLKTHTSIWCRKVVKLTSITSGAAQTTSSAPGSPLPPMRPKEPGTCRQVADPVVGPWETGVEVRNVDVGELVGHWDNTEVSDRNQVLAYMDVSVHLTRQAGVSKDVGIDYVSMNATAGDRVGTGPLTGYPRPKDPFTVTWNPVNPDPADPGAGVGTRGGLGDATFNVFGSVSVPNNDVRVVWNRGANSAGPVGYPIFNAGKVPYSNCNLSLRDGCRPALVASALGSWTTGTWEADLAPALRPDPLASTGNYRDPFRQVRIVACVVRSDSSGNDTLLPRVHARVVVGDRDGRAVVPGASVRVDQWAVLGNGPHRVGADARTGACNAVG